MPVRDGNLSEKYENDLEKGWRDSTKSCDIHGLRGKTAHRELDLNGFTEDQKHDVSPPQAVSPRRARGPNGVRGESRREAAETLPGTDRRCGVAPLTVTLSFTLGVRYFQTQSEG